MMINCDICDRSFEIESFDAGKCPDCGAEYQYDEGYTLMLTEEMRNRLRGGKIDDKQMPTVLSQSRGFKEMAMLILDGSADRNATEFLQNVKVIMQKAAEKGA